MPTLDETINRHKKWIAKELKAALGRDGLERGRKRRHELSSFIDRMLGALLARMRIHDDPELPLLLRRYLRDEDINPGVLTGALLRLAAAVRSVIFLETRNRRIAHTASAAIDRALAEVFEELRDDLGGTTRREATALDGRNLARTRVMPAFDRSKTMVDARPKEKREPTIIRNIQEILATGAGELQPATVVAVAFRDGEGARNDVLRPTVTAVALSLREDAYEQLKQAMVAAGARLVLDHPSLVCCAFAATVGDADIGEAVTLATALARCEDIDACVGVAQGALLMQPASGSNETIRPSALGAALTRAIALSTWAGRQEILCDEDVRRACGETHEIVAVDGLPATYRLEAQRLQWLDRWEHAAFVSEPQVVGHTQLRRRLISTLRAPSQKVSVIGLRGRAGAGKLTLLVAALADLGVGRDRLLLGQPHPLASAPYWPLMTIARRILGLSDEPLRSAVLEERVAELAASSASTSTLRGVLPMLHALVGVVRERDEDVLIEELEPAAMREEIAGSLRALLAAAADRAPDRPLVLMLRDVQNVDAPTMHALGHLLRTYDGAAQLVVVLASQSAFKPPVDFVEAGYTEITVGPLADDAVIAIARSMLDQEDLPAGLAALLAARCDGSPMMTAVLIRHLVESGALQRVAGTWESVAVPGAESIPRRLRDLLRRRINQLPEHLADMLESAATIGESLPQQILELVWVSRGVSRDEVKQAGALFEEMGFFCRDDHGALRFAHPMLRKVAYRMQSDTARCEIHQLVRIAYNETYPDAVAQIPALLFHHAQRAGDALGARSAAVYAVRRAALLHDHDQGLAIADQALALCTDDDPDTRAARFDILAARERICDARGFTAALIEARMGDLEEMGRLAMSLGGGARLGLVMHRSARLHLLAGDLPEAINAAKEALGLLKEGDPLDLSNALRTVALIYWRAREPAKAAAALKKALSLYERLGHRRGMGFVLHNLGMFFLDSGALEKAHGVLTRALEIKEDTDDQRGRAAVFDALGEVAFLEGNLDAATECFEQALAVRFHSGDRDGTAPSQVSLGRALLHKNPTRAQELAREALRQSRGKRMARTEIAANILLAAALLRLGRRQAAGKPASQAVERAHTLGAKVLELRARLGLAEIHLAYQGRRRAEQAMVEAETAARRALDLGAMRWRIEALSLMATALVRLDVGEAVRAAQEALATMAKRHYAGLDEAAVRSRCDAVFAVAAEA